MKQLYPQTNPIHPMNIPDPTPRTDSLCFKETMESSEVVLATFARDLEAEVERLTAELHHATSNLARGDR